MSEPKVYYKTPRGEFLYPKLTKPDTKFHAEGVYDAKIMLCPSDARDELLKTIEEKAAESLATAQKEHPKVKNIVASFLPFKEEVDEETGVVTGNVILHAKMRAKITPKDGKDPWTQQPSLFDAKNNLIDPKSISPWNGTIGIISFEIYPFYRPATRPGEVSDAGVSLRLKAAQIIKLVEGKGQNAEDYGFEPDEEGYTADQSGFDQRPEPPERGDDDLPF